MADDVPKVFREEPEVIDQVGLGEVKVLPPHEQARLGMAYWLLGGIFLLFLLSGLAMVFGPECRLKQVETLFEFTKTLCPPLITLVIGFYFRASEKSET